MRTKLLALAAMLAVPFAVQDPAEKAAAASTPTATVGEPAPAFRLNDHDGKAVSIGGKAKHWTVLAFYPKAATPG